jgi:hypothetical protein
MESRVMTDTERLPRRASWAAHAAVALLAGAVWLPTGADAAASLPRVLWVRGDHAYVALADTASVEEGDAVDFREREKTVAAGEVAGLYRGEMALVHVTSGSLARARKVYRLRLTFRRPALPALAAFRIGVPSAHRNNLLFPCAYPAPGIPPGSSYRAPDVGARAWRLVRDVSEIASPASAAWPETLVVSLFDEAADEEIAIERGEVDAAVFWPGELSSRMRDDPRWRGYPSGTRARGVVAMILAGAGDPSAPLDTTAVSALNEQLFRGDLAPWLRGRESATQWNTERRAYRPILDVDEALPGHGWLQTRLDQGPYGAGYQPYLSGVIAGVSVARARLTYLDVPPDSVDLARATPLFTIRCPVVVGAAHRRRVLAMGPDALADLLQCPSRGTAP